MNETPKTDAKAQFFGWNPDEGEEFVPSEFARELERENNALRAKVAEQGLSLACLADGILGENATDRRDQTLVAVGCQMARQHAVMREALTEIAHHDDGAWAAGEKHYAEARAMGRANLKHIAWETLGKIDKP